MARDCQGLTRFHTEIVSSETATFISQSTAATRHRRTLDIVCFINGGSQQCTGWALKPGHHVPYQDDSGVARVRQDLVSKSGSIFPSEIVSPHRGFVAVHVKGRHHSQSIAVCQQVDCCGLVP